MVSPVNIKSVKMSHFYRVVTHQDARENPDIYYIGRVDEAGNSVSGRLSAKLFEHQFQPVSDANYPEGMELFEAPLIDRDFLNFHAKFKFKTGIEFPDMWIDGGHPIVSEKAKSVIESIDEFGHQFSQVNVYDQNMHKVNAIPYYRLNVRRIVKVEPDESLYSTKLAHAVFYEERNILPIVLSEPEIKDVLSGLFLWRFFGVRDSIYMSETMLSALKAAGVTGLEPFSGFLSKPGEAVAKFM